MVCIMALFSSISNANTNDERSIYQQRQFTYPNGLTKAVIISYDDGLEQDERLVQLLNKYNLIGTFNLNSGSFDKPAPWLKQFTGKEGKYVAKDKVANIYQGHEIASHLPTHPNISDKSTTFILDNLADDINVLELNSKTKVSSFAYPFGAYDDHAVSTLKTTQLTNARTVNDTQQFSLPDDFFIWHPTTHHNKASQTVDQFINSRSEQPILYYLWGHSWEFDQNKNDNNWLYIENIFKRLSGNSEVWYVGSGEFVNYINAVKDLTLVSGEYRNNSRVDVWIKTNNKIRRIAPKSF